VLIVYVPVPPVPVPSAVIYVPATILPPVIYVPIARAPDVTADTVSVVVDIVPVTTAVDAAPMALKLVVPRDTILYCNPGVIVVALIVPPITETLNVEVTPSFIDVGCDEKLYTADAADTSTIVTDVDVATIVPVIDPVLMLTVKLLEPSLIRSEIGVILKDPVLLVIVNDPDNAVKSAFELLILLTVKYSVVALATLTVVIVKEPAEPSLIEVGVVENV
jgi:hypothetical protein